MKKIFLLWGAFAICAFSYAQTEVFINEIHYDNGGLDSGEGVEIAGPAGTDLTGWTLVFYNGVGGTVYDSKALTGLIPNKQNNRGMLWFAHANIQNGVEGIALIDPNNFVVQFLSYGGSFAATDGLANGMTSVDIVVVEDGSDPVGESLQLTGLDGTYYEDFTWMASSPETEGVINSGQTFEANPAILASNSISGMIYEFGSGPSNEGSIMVSGTNLTNDIVLTAPTNFEISETTGGSFSTSINLTPNSGAVLNTTIYVRLKTGLNIGNYIENFIITSSGAVSKTVVLSGNVAPNAGSIIVTEIMNNPSIVTDANGEYFEVYNTTGTDIDMNGWIISDNGGSTHTINLPVVVPSQEYAVFGLNADSFTNGGFTVDYEYVSTFTLANTSDEIILTTSAEMGSVIIDQVYYDDTNFPNNPGKSIELHLYEYNYVSNDTGSNWGAATASFGIGDLGTPGTNNDFGLSVVKNQIEGFRMYPNPVLNGNVYFISDSRIEKQVEIYSISGQLVYKNSVKSKEFINVSNLNGGIYLVKILAEGRIATRKLIIH